LQLGGSPTWSALHDEEAIAFVHTCSDDSGLSTLLLHEPAFPQQAATACWTQTSCEVVDPHVASALQSACATSVHWLWAVTGVPSGFLTRHCMNSCWQNALVIVLHCWPTVLPPPLPLLPPPDPPLLHATRTEPEAMKTTSARRGRDERNEFMARDLQEEGKARIRRCKPPTTVL
jgi:hypothetical protein